MNASEILDFLNKNPDRKPESFLRIARTGEKFVISGKECELVRNNMLGGVEVLCPDGEIDLHVDWNEEQGRWFLKPAS